MFVTGLSDTAWSQLTIQTLELTGGSIDLPIDVADRCKTTHASEGSTRILLLLLGQDEPWERYYVARAATEMLRSVIQGSADENFKRLRDQADRTRTP